LILLADHAGRDAVDVGNVRTDLPCYQRQLGWTVALWSVVNLPKHAVSLITSSDATDAIVNIAFMVLGLMLTVRITILLPAISMIPGQTFERFFFTCEARTAHGSGQGCSRKRYRP
jgi:hypothetical protein